MGLLNAPMTPKMKADLERMNALRAELEQLEMEIEENNQRKEFTEAELLEGYRRLEKLRNPGFFYKIYLFFKHLFQKMHDFFFGKK